MRKLIEYMKWNPEATSSELAGHFEKELDIPRQVELLLQEGTEYDRIRTKIRPIYAQRQEVEEKMKYMLSDMEMEVYLEYPPRKGSDTQREAMRNSLKQENEAFVQLQQEFRSKTSEITELEDGLKVLDMNAKNARRLTELFAEYMKFIAEKSKEEKVVNDVVNNNLY